MTKPATPPNASEFVFHQGEDGRSRIQVRLNGGTVWLTQRLLADLYQVAVPPINEHLANVLAEEELDPAPTIRKFRIVQTEVDREVSRLIDHYNLDVNRTRLTVELSEADEFNKAAKQLGTKKTGKPDEGGP